MRQILYDNKTLTLNFWSAYSKVKYEGERLTIINTLNQFAVTLIGLMEPLNRLYEALSVGVDDNTLISLLKETGCAVSVEELLYKGIIE